MTEDVQFDAVEASLLGLIGIRERLASLLDEPSGEPEAPRDSPVVLLLLGVVAAADRVERQLEPEVGADARASLDLHDLLR